MTESRIGPLLALAGFTWFLGTFASSSIDAFAVFGAAFARSIAVRSSTRLAAPDDTVEETVGRIFAKIGLTESAADVRRVLSVLTFLRAER